MVGVEILDRGLVLPAWRYHRAAALAGVVVAHDAIRAEAGRTAETRRIVTRLRRRHR